MRIYIIVFAILFLKIDGEVVFNEVMSNVRGVDSGIGSPGDRNEFIELYNISDTTINIMKYHLSDMDATDYFSMYPDSLEHPGGIINDSMVASGSFVVILDREYSDVGDSVNYMVYEIPNDAYVFTISNTAFGETGLSTKDALYLLDENDSIIDSFGTPAENDGFPYDPGDGVSWEKLNYYYPDSPSSYSSCTISEGNTIGKQNSLFIEGLLIDSISVRPYDNLCSLLVYFNNYYNATDKLIVQFESDIETSEIDSNVVIMEIENTLYEIANLRTLSSERTKTVLTRKSYNPGSIVINEFMVSGTEWLELYNPHKMDFYTDGITLINSSDTIDLEYGVIGGENYILLAKDTSEVKSEYYDMHLNLMECDLFSLPNREDTFSLYFGNILLDSVIRGYENSPSSIERLSYEIGGFRRENWDNSIDFRGATPCMKNSISLINLSDTDSFSLYPEILTETNPNLFLRIKLSDYKGMLNVKIYDELGVLIDFPVKDKIIDNEETIFIKRLNSLLHNGIYLLHIDIETPHKRINKLLMFAVRNN